MGTYTVKQYQKVWRAKARAIEKAGIKSVKDAATFMVYTARGMAPKKSGATLRGIVARPMGTYKTAVRSYVNSTFKQNLWANQTAPFRTIHPWWNHGTSIRIAGTKGIVTSVAGAPTVYGDGSHKVTGKPRFFHFATLDTRDNYLKIARKNTQKALRVGLG
jgi:hypothetical protein